MSDYFQSYVFGEPIGSDGSGDLSRITAYLLAEQIITAQMVDAEFCEGHMPGPRAASIMVEDNDYWRGFSNKGVELVTGRIIEASTRFQQGECPQCHAAIDVGDEAFAVVDDALSAFHDGLGDDVECPNCRTRCKLSDWDFDHGLAVGRAMAKFWNWPDLVEGLEAKFEALSAMKCKKVWGRL
jgi:hypothetical protein